MFSLVLISLAVGIIFNDTCHPAKIQVKKQRECPPCLSEKDSKRALALIEFYVGNILLTLTGSFSNSMAWWARRGCDVRQNKMLS